MTTVPDAGMVAGTVFGRYPVMVARTLAAPAGRTAAKAACGGAPPVAPVRTAPSLVVRRTLAPSSGWSLLSASTTRTMTVAAVSCTTSSICAPAGPMVTIRSALGSRSVETLISPCGTHANWKRPLRSVLVWYGLPLGSSSGFP